MSDIYQQFAHAIRSGDILQVALLVKTPNVDAILNTKGEDKQYILQHAIRNGNAQIVEMLLNAGANPNIEQRMGVLELAAGNGDFDSLNLLLNNGADPNMYVGSCTIFAYICQYASLEVIKWLLDRGADICEYVIPGSSPFVFACLDVQKKTSRYEVAEYFIRNYKQEIKPTIPYVIYEMCTVDDDVDILELLVRHGADVNEMYTNDVGVTRTPLMHALDDSGLRCDMSINYLLKNGVDVQIPDSNGRTIADRLEMLQNKS